MKLVHASAFGDVDRLTSEVLPWIYEAGNPYVEWFWGSEVVAREQLQAWLGRPSSELSIRRCVVLFDGSHTHGGYIALPGKELADCRKSDLLAINSYVRLTKDEVLLRRLRPAGALFPPVAGNVYYLSRLGVAPESRGRGLGKQLLNAFLAEGAGLGYNAFRLDVSSTNEKAIRLYETHGFAISSEHGSEDTPLRYVSLVRVNHQDDV